MPLLKSFDFLEPRFVCSHVRNYSVKRRSSHSRIVASNILFRDSLSNVLEGDKIQYPYLLFIYIFKFKFILYVQGPNSTEDAAHVAYSWVILHLRDLNDNDPVFTKSTSTVSLREDVPLGTLVDIMAARDPDQGGEGKVTYRIDRGSDKRRQFRISEAGELIVQRELDRETCPVHKVPFAFFV